MKEIPFLRRTLVPVAIVAACALLSNLVYFGLRGVDASLINQTVRIAAATAAGALYFLSTAFGPFFVYRATQRRGASVGESILAAVAVPFAWMTKEVLLLVSSHPFIECLYWYLNPFNIWFVLLIAAECGAAALIVRRGRVRAGEPAGSARVPALVIAFSVALIVFLYAWGKGENVYVIFLEGYRFLFGTGV
ncbi:MAG: hypothetical protein JXA20_12435 [Spirochaetes bacterium]|nr:hypothetical protein [Spirochaetota bacterium]